VSAPAPGRVQDTLCVLVIATLALAPLALGSVTESAFVPLLVVCFGVGGVSWARGHVRRTLGEEVPKVPLARVLLAFHVLVLFQLVPLPPFLLRRLSPGSFAHYYDRLLLPVARFWPISVNPADTLRGLAFLAGYSLLFGAVFREFAEGRWRRRLAYMVIVVGLFMTLVGLVQSAYGTKAIYGVIHTIYDWAIFGPYVNRSHFAGYIVMAIPLAVGFAIEALAGLRREWRSRRRGFVTLGGPEANAFVRRSAEAMMLLVGLIASQSRGGIVAFAASMAALPFTGRHRRAAAAVVLLVALLGLPWLGLGEIVKGFESRGIQASRIDMWRDMLPMFPSFPLLGSGFNAFGTAYAPFQTIWRSDFIGQAHDEYLQVLLDTGLVGAGLFAVIFGRTLKAAAAAASRSAFGVGLFGGILALAVHALVDFNWQIPANAATYIALAALAFREAGPRLDPPGLPHLESFRPSSI
jgi:O-antigen ligase